MYSYSQRLSWASSANAFSGLLAARRAAGFPLLDLTVSNPTEVLSDYPHTEIARALSSISDFTYRPDPCGVPEARSAIAAYYRERSVAVSEGRILLTASTSEAYSLLFKLFCDAGDEILVPVPSYPLFEYLAALESVATVTYRLLYDGNWFIDLEHLRDRISERTRAIVVVNPNNPTGSFLKRREMERLLDLARERQLPIISDEVFSDYSMADRHGFVWSFSEFDSALTVSLNGLSKTAGMPQMKLGWMVLNGPASQVALARGRLEIVLDTYLSVATPVQRALTHLFDIGATVRDKLKRRVRKNLEAAHEILSRSPAHCLHTEGGWSAIIQLPNILSEEHWIARLVEEALVAAQPGYFYDMASEPFVIVSLITRPDIFRDALGRLRQLTLHAR
ncbi:MAG: pyridoxal phosphate-dependent aminotransferase [Acidobacteriaceae bacterium]|nr:pyridoxal phosphate-dependent aminotransferase [Acidobacteriaceae bacterium]